MNIKITQILLSNILNILQIRYIFANKVNDFDKKKIRIK